MGKFAHRSSHAGEPGIRDRDDETKIFSLTFGTSVGNSNLAIGLYLCDIASVAS
jgi:hypothetical protein